MKILTLSVHGAVPINPWMLGRLGTRVQYKDVTRPACLTRRPCLTVFSLYLLLSIDVFELFLAAEE